MMETVSRRKSLGVLAGLALTQLLPSWLHRKPHNLVEYGEDGIPIRASIRKDSPYPDPNPSGTRITVDGRKPAYAFEYDRREGWVLQDRWEHSARYTDELKGEPKDKGKFLGSFRLRGRVEVRYT